jgi:methionyl aminopeptidase
LNETFCVGNVDDEGRKLVKTAFDCLAAAIDMVKPGTLYRDLGTKIHKVAKENQCSVVRTYCGHGIGSLFHTAPNVPHYHKNKAKVTNHLGDLELFQIHDATLTCVFITPSPSTTIGNNESWTCFHH